MKKYIAIVGTIAAGKTTAAKFLTERGYIHYKLNQGIYDEADRRGLDKEDRVVLQDLGDELRAKRGVDVLAKIVIEKVNSGDPDAHYVIESIRNHNELIALQKEFGDDLAIISVDAPLEVRYERAVERKGQYKEQDMTLEEFKRNSDRDLGIGNSENEQNVGKCIEMADTVVINSDGIVKFEKDVLEAVGIK